MLQRPKPEPSQSQTPVLPGSTIGILGGGQLGRMMTIAAKRMGYRVVVLEPLADSPAGQVADDQIVAEYTDLEAARDLATRSRAVTVEFENVPFETLAAIEPRVVVRPSSRVIKVAQHRILEKRFLSEAAAPVAKFRGLGSLGDLKRAAKDIGFPSVLKTARGGYDGKGQVILQSQGDMETAWSRLKTNEAILEEFIEMEKEISVIVARTPGGQVACYAPSENTHAHHILDTAVMPARITETQAQQAQRLAMDIAAALDVVGLLTVEMFVAKDGRILVNELAPRPHNSGHQTFDGAVTSQFEQAIRAVCNLPLGSPDLYRPTAIANLLGDLWMKGEPAWAKVFALPDVKLHLYGKMEARPGRKMGHLTASGRTASEALQKVTEARAAITR